MGDGKWLAFQRSVGNSCVAIIGLLMWCVHCRCGSAVSNRTWFSKISELAANQWSVVQGPHLCSLNWMVWWIWSLLNIVMSEPDWLDWSMLVLSLWEGALPQSGSESMNHCFNMKIWIRFKVDWKEMTVMSEDLINLDLYLIGEILARSSMLSHEGYQERWTSFELKNNMV